jgi:Domain of unknown function (DUF4432)
MNYNYTKNDVAYLKERIGCIEQLAFVRKSILDDGRGKGTSIARVVNGSGLDFTVGVDRGMDIFNAYYKGIPLAFIAPPMICHPAFYEPEGLSWLRNWGSGLLTGCGLRNVGAPNEHNGEELGLHGRLSNLPAENFHHCCKEVDGKYVIKVTGVMRQSRLFFEHLQLKRVITTALGDNSITIEDTIENLSSRPSPLMILYHMNLGYPLVDEGISIEAVEHKMTPQNEIASVGLPEWDQAQAPTPGFVEQVIYHEIPPAVDGFAQVTLKNPKLGLGFKLNYRTAELPFFVQWKQMGVNEYVMGFEPGNCIPEGQANNAEKGLLREIAPGEVVKTCVKAEIIEL